MEIKDSWQIKSDMLDDITFSINKEEGTYTYDIISACAIGIEDMYTYSQGLEKELLPWTATQDYYIDLHLKTFGLERRQAKTATGFIRISGTKNTLIPKGFRVNTDDGIFFKTTEEGIISVTGSIDLDIEAEVAGISGNVAIGLIEFYEFSIPTVSGVTNPEATGGGAEKETPSEANARMEQTANTTSSGGNVGDYKTWALEVEGVGFVDVYGAGVLNLDTGQAITVTGGNVIIYVAGVDLSIPSSETVTNLDNFLETVRPLGANPQCFPFKNFPFDITGKIKYQAGFTLSKITSDFNALLIEELKKIEFVRNDPNISTKNLLNIYEIARLLYSVKGVINFIDFQINGQTSSVEFPYNKLAHLNTTLFTEWV